MQNKVASVSKKPAACTLDIRPIFASGASPCGLIDQAVASLKPNQTFVLIAPFEPIPLFTKLRAQGFEHQSAPQADGSWKIVFERTDNGEAPASPAKHQSCCCSEEL